jgi:hypothetical protein
MIGRRAYESRRLKEQVIGPTLGEATQMLKESGVQAQAIPFSPTTETDSIALLAIPGTPILHFGATHELQSRRTPLDHSPSGTVSYRLYSFTQARRAKELKRSFGICRPSSSLASLSPIARH